jgi:hypothetical protein
VSRIVLASVGVEEPGGEGSTQITSNSEMQAFQSANSINNTELYSIFNTIGYDNATVAAMMQAGTLYEETILAAR